MTAKTCLGAVPPYRSVVHLGNEVSTSEALRYYFIPRMKNTDGTICISVEYICKLMSALPIWESIRKLWPEDARPCKKRFIKNLFNKYHVRDREHDGFLLMLLWWYTCTLNKSPYYNYNQCNILEGASNLLKICRDRGDIDSYKKFWLYVAFSPIGYAKKTLNFSLELFFIPLNERIIKKLFINMIPNAEMNWPLNINLKILEKIVRYKSTHVNVHIIEGLLGRCVDNPDMLTTDDVETVKKKIIEWIDVGLEKVPLFWIKS